MPNGEPALATTEIDVDRLGFQIEKPHRVPDRVDTALWTRLIVVIDDVDEYSRGYAQQRLKPLEEHSHVTYSIPTSTSSQTIHGRETMTTPDSH